MLTRIVPRILPAVLALLVFSAAAGPRMLSAQDSGAPKIWTIGVLTGPSPFQLVPPLEAENPVLTAAVVTDADVDILAHPFLAVTDSMNYMFFTAKHGPTGGGGIGMARSSDGLEWEYGGMVVDEPFEISYPYVFQADGEWYMLPETYTTRTLRLYRAVEFPGKWELHSVLLRGESFVSPTVFSHDGRWWLFTGRLGNETLRLFHADNLTGPWTEHPASPLVQGNPDIARPAGRPLEIDGRLFRLGQDCRPTYGNRVLAFEVTELTPETYSERPVNFPLIRADGDGWNSDAMHHMDCRRLSDGSWLVAVDALGAVGDND